MRRNPGSADSVLRTGLSSYLRNVNPEMTEEQISAMADANAVLMESLANAQGRTAADFVEGLTGLGVTDDPSLRGQYREENGARTIVLNPATMSPTTFSHEVGHYFLMTLPDGPVKDRIINTYKAEYKADGNTVGKNLHEAFVNGLAEYQASGVAQNAEIRGNFQRLINAMKSFIDRLRKSGGLSAEQIALYDSLFSQNKEMAINEEVSQKDSLNIGMSEAEFVTKYEGLADTAPLMEIKESRFPDTGNRDLVDRVLAFYKENYGDSVEREGIGKVSLSKRNIKDSMSHGYVSPEKAAAFEAVPEIIMNGGLLAYEKDYDGPNLDRILIASPITFKGEEYVCEVCIKKSPTSNRFYFHGVEVKNKLFPDASKDQGANALPVASERASKLMISRIYDKIKKNQAENSTRQNLTSDSSTINLNDVVLNETIDEDNLSPEQRALRDRIKRGRAAQAQRRRRFYENIDAMLDKNMYVESDDLRRYRSNLERELREAHENDPGFKFTDDARYRRVFEEYHARDMMLL